MDAIGYRLAEQTKITLGDTLASTWRNYSNTSWVGSNTLAAKLRGPVMDNLYGSLRAS